MGSLRPKTELTYLVSMSLDIEPSTITRDWHVQPVVKDRSGAAWAVGSD